MKLNLFAILLFLLLDVTLLSNDYPDSACIFSTSELYSWTDARNFLLTIKYDKDDANKTTTILRSLLEHHPARSPMFSPPNATPENTEKSLSNLMKLMEKIYRNGFLFYADVYKLINTGGLPATVYFFPCLPLSPSVSPNYDVTIDSTENKTVLNEINFVFAHTSPQNSLHANDNDNPKATITYIKINPDELEDVPGEAPADTLLG